MGSIDEVALSAEQAKSKVDEVVLGMLGIQNKQRAASVLDTKLRKSYIFLDNASQQLVKQSAKVREERQTKRSFIGWSNTQCQKAGLRKLPKKIALQDLIPLHQSWNDYARRLLGACQGKAKVAQQRVATMDLQGAYIKIIRSGSPTFVGLHGVILLESLNALHLALLPQASQRQSQRAEESSTMAKVVVVPKEGKTFALAIDDNIVMVQGDLIKGRQLPLV
ncbi:unnamed protein product [Chrysoparadoxa australica]